MNPRNPGGLGVGCARRRVAVELTPTECVMLYQLAAQAPNVLTHDLLLRRVWGPEHVGEGRERLAGFPCKGFPANDFQEKGRSRPSG